MQQAHARHYESGLRHYESSGVIATASPPKTKKQKQNKTKKPGNKNTTHSHS